MPTSVQMVEFSLANILKTFGAVPSPVNHQWTIHR